MSPDAPFELGIARVQFAPAVDEYALPKPCLVRTWRLAAAAAFTTYTIKRAFHLFNVYMHCKRLVVCFTALFIFLFLALTNGFFRCHRVSDTAGRSKPSSSRTPPLQISAPEMGGRDIF